MGKQERITVELEEMGDDGIVSIMVMVSQVNTCVKTNKLYTLNTGSS